MNIKFDRVVAYNMEPPLRYHIRLSNSSLHSHIFFYPRRVPLILQKAIIRLPLLVREYESSVLAFPNPYVTVHEIHGSF